MIQIIKGLSAELAKTGEMTKIEGKIHKHFIEACIKESIYWDVSLFS